MRWLRVGRWGGGGDGKMLRDVEPLKTFKQPSGVEMRIQGNKKLWLGWREKCRSSDKMFYNFPPPFFCLESLVMEKP